MITKSSSHIKRAQKEARLMREISQLLMKISLDDPSLQGIFINKVLLSPDKSVCNIFFYAVDGEEAFRKILPRLILYKPSLRKALATAIPSRYTPELVFKFDAQFEKQKRIEDLLEKIKEEK